MGVIEVEGLRKEYRRLRGGRTIAVDGLDLDVPEGGVFGFLGPNGAGKTTTIAACWALVRPSGGTRLMGADVPGSLAGVIGAVGSIVEQPALFRASRAAGTSRSSAVWAGTTTRRSNRCWPGWVSRIEGADAVGPIHSG
jgi:ABC-type multidrug transport system ATPase subunit